mgnify:CR=1 FL=1
MIQSHAGTPVIFQSFGLTGHGDEAIDKLLSRVNIVPLPMVVIQAVEESGWGTSRFARQGPQPRGVRNQAFGSVGMPIEVGLHPSQLPSTCKRRPSAKPNGHPFGQLPVDGPSASD